MVGIEIPQSGLHFHLEMSRRCIHGQGCHWNIPARYKELIVLKTEIDGSPGEGVPGPIVMVGKINGSCGRSFTGLYDGTKAIFCCQPLYSIFVGTGLEHAAGDDLFFQPFSLPFQNGPGLHAVAKELKLER